MDEMRRLACMTLGDALFSRQETKNGGRGVECLRLIALLLKSGKLDMAKAAISNDWDKIGSYTDIAEWLIENRLFTPMKFYS